MNGIKKVWGLKLCALGMVAAMLGLGVPKAEAQVTPGTIVALTNVPATIATGTVTNGINSFMPVYKGRGLAWQGIFNVSSGSSNVVYYFSPSVDGTNIAGPQAAVAGGPGGLWILTCTAQQTTNQNVYTNWSAATLEGFAAVVLVGITNQNAGTFTNKGSLYRATPGP